MKAIVQPTAKSEDVHEAKRRLNNSNETLSEAGIDPVSVKKRIDLVD